MEYITKCKYTFKTIQMITKLDEVFNHLLHMNSLPHSNSIWRVPLMWFHKKCMDENFIQTSVNMYTVNTQKVVEKFIIWKLIKFVLEVLCQKSILYVYQNNRRNQKIYALKIIQNVPKK